MIYPLYNVNNVNTNIIYKTILFTNKRAQVDILQISEENGFLKKLYYPIITISIIITIKLMIAKRKRNSIQLLFLIKSMNVVQLLSGVCLEKLEREHKYLQ